MRFAIDIDGVLFERANYPHIGKLNEQMIDTLLQLQEHGHKVHMYTAREGNAMGIIHERLKEVGFVFDPYEYPSNGKIRADFYVDDRAIQPTALPIIVESFLGGKNVEDRWGKE